MISQRLRAAVTHWNDVLDQFAKKFRAGMFFVARLCWPACADDVVELQPMWDQALHVHRKKSSQRTRLVAEEKRFAFGRERIFVSVRAKQFKPYERVHDRAQPPNRRSGCFTDLLGGLRSVCQSIENFVTDSGADNQRWRIGKTKLHQTLRGNLIFFRIFHFDVCLRFVCGNNRQLASVLTLANRKYFLVGTGKSFPELSGELRMFLRPSFASASVAP